jgi:hypothetical protein
LFCIKATGVAIRTAKPVSMNCFIRPFRWDGGERVHVGKFIFYCILWQVVGSREGIYSPHFQDNRTKSSAPCPQFWGVGGHLNFLPAELGAGGKFEILDNFRLLLSAYLCDIT